MDEELRQNIRSGSTTYEWKRVKVRGTPAGRAKRAEGASRWSKLVGRDRTSPLTVTLRYRGGAESWWLVEARGRRGAFPGWMGLDDVMAEINRSPEFYSRQRGG